MQFGDANNSSVPGGSGNACLILELPMQRGQTHEKVWRGAVSSLGARLEQGMDLVLSGLHLGEPELQS